MNHVRHRWYWGGLTGLAAALLLLMPGAADALVGDVLEVIRESGGNVEAVEYVIEDVGECSLKFEDAELGLGEDGAVETDTFVIAVENAGTSVTVETKASTSAATSVLDGVGASNLDDLGFRVTLVSVEDGVFTIEITSEDVQHALSHVTFSFLVGNLAEPMYD